MSETTERKPDLVTIEIDGHEVEAPKGSMVIEAADRIGIDIPRFCYHRKLSIAANCRMCLVDVEKAPKPLPACATPVMEGMKVFTHSKRARDAQRGVMEFLLINHPLDCPICDQGGECELQDLAMGYGRSVSRFVERKRVVKDEDLGPLIATDMTRCIHCTRCVRFLEEIAGTNELGGMGRGEEMKIQTFIGRSVDSELSGNIIDLCPVGALTNKPFRFKARAWELRAYPCVANHDSVGSEYYAHVRTSAYQNAGQVVRTVPRDNEATNETWLADRDRWSHLGLASEDRAVVPLARSKDGLTELSWDNAIARTATALRGAAPEEVGILVSPRASAEELHLLAQLAKGVGTANIDHRLRELDFSDDEQRATAPSLGMSLAQLEKADAVLLVGANVRHDQPLLGHRLRKSQRVHGKAIYAVDLIDRALHFDLAGKQIARPSAWPQYLNSLVEGEQADWQRAFRTASNPVILLGDQARQHPQAAALRTLAARLAGAWGASFGELPEAANGFAAWQLGVLPHREAGGVPRESGGLSIRQMLSEPRGVYVLYDFEPELDTAYTSALEKALEQAEKVVFIGSYVSPWVERFADVILPIATGPEIDATYFTMWGLALRHAACARAPGDARAGWKVLRVLANALELPGFRYRTAAEIRDEFSQHLDVREEYRADESSLDLSGPQEGPEIFVEAPIYAVDATVRRSQALQQSKLAEAATALMHPTTAASHDLTGAEVIRLTFDDAELELPLVLSERVADGVVRVPGQTAGSAMLQTGTPVRLERVP